MVLEPNFDYNNMFMGIGATAMHESQHINHDIKISSHVYMHGSSVAAKIPALHISSQAVFDGKGY